MTWWPPQVAPPSVILLTFREVILPGADSSETSAGPAPEPEGSTQCVARSPTGRHEESLHASVIAGTIPEAADEVVHVSAVEGVSSDPGASLEPVPSTGSSFRAEEEANDPVVPKEMEATLRESNKHVWSLGNAFRRLGQAIQPGMEVILWSRALYT